jgi:hypothetical protein
VNAFRNISVEESTVALPCPPAEEPPLLDPPPQELIAIEDRINAVHVKNLGIVILYYRVELIRGAIVLEPAPPSYPEPLPI